MVDVAEVLASIYAHDWAMRDLCFSDGRNEIFFPNVRQCQDASTIDGRCRSRRNSSGRESSLQTSDQSEVNTDVASKNESIFNFRDLLFGNSLFLFFHRIFTIPEKWPNDDSRQWWWLCLGIYLLVCQRHHIHHCDADRAKPVSMRCLPVRSLVLRVQDEHWASSRYMSIAAKVLVVKSPISFCWRTRHQSSWYEAMDFISDSLISKWIAIRIRTMKDIHLKESNKRIRLKQSVVTLHIRLKPVGERLSLTDSDCPMYPRRPLWTNSDAISTTSNSATSIP